jgi:V/A-type H+-transporting ATPase subunit I
MDHLTVVGLASEREAVIDALMRLGAVELIETSHETDSTDSSQAMTTQPADFSATGELPVNALSRLEMAIRQASLIKPVKKQMFTGRRKVDARQFLAVASREQEILDQVSLMEQHLAAINSCRAQLAVQQNRCTVLEPWRSLDLDLAEQGTEHVSLFLGNIDTPDHLDQIRNQLRDEAPESLIEVLSNGEDYLCCAVAVWKPHASAALALLRRSGFSSMPMQGESGKPAGLLEEAKREIGRLEAEINRLEEENRKLADHAADFELLHDFLLVRSDRLQASAMLPLTESTYILQGWVPSNLVEAVKKGLQTGFLVAVDSRPARQDEEYPILLRNSKFVKPFEVVVEMFSPPSTKDVDAAPLVAPFFFFFFGMMLSDIGYGLILAGLCGYLIYAARKKGGEANRLLTMLFLCGISSVVWGVLFGGLFGDMITVLSQGKLTIPALWFNPMDDATKLMIWSMIFGVIHLFTGMGAKAWILIRTGHVWDAILDIFPWYLVITGLGLMLGNIGGSVGTVMALAGAGVLLLFGGRDARNPIMRLVKGLLSLYNITGYFSDILSYTRILALVLATSVIAMVVNLLGFIGGPSIVGFIFYALVALLGHGLNLALSALSAYVHTSRLQYVEFFGKFYDGGGRLWKPLNLRTRYVQLVRMDGDPARREA